MFAYRDQKQAKQDKQSEPPVDLAGASVVEAKKYKRPHCFSLRLVDGGEFMLKAKDDAEMKLWIDSLKFVIGEPESSGLSQPSRAQTLPASSSAPEKKKGGFLTLKRK